MKFDGKHLFFYGGIFSQWYPSKFKFCGVQYTHAEQFMMAGKAIVFDDKKSLRKIMKAEHPFDQKKLGRMVRNFNHDKWMEYAFDIVTIGNYLKFKQNDNLMFSFESYANGGNTIFVEASPTDKIWGIGLSVQDKDVLDESKWRGTNLLGKAINRAYNMIKFDVYDRESTIERIGELYSE